MECEDQSSSKLSPVVSAMESDLVPILQPPDSNIPENVEGELHAGTSTVNMFIDLTAPHQMMFLILTLTFQIFLEKIGLWNIPILSMKLKTFGSVIRKIIL